MLAELFDLSDKHPFSCERVFQAHLQVYELIVAQCLQEMSDLDGIVGMNCVKERDEPDESDDGVQQVHHGHNWTRGGGLLPAAARPVFFYGRHSIRFLRAGNVALPG